MGLRYYDYSLALFDTTVKTADKTYADDYCRLTGQYYDTLQAIDHGGTIDADYYANGGSSLNVQICFPAGTPIILADGSTKNIEDILPGDIVKTADHQKPDGTITDGRVARVFKNDPQPLWRLKFEDFEICATKGHPFYVKGKGWVVAENLTIGDACRSADDRNVTLIRKDFEPELVPVFNFEVENRHTYFVGYNCSESVLVHNECYEWHHLLPSQFSKDFQKAGITDEMRGLSEFGWILEQKDHRGTDGIHSNWNNDWENFFAKYGKTSKIPKDAVMEQLATMKKKYANTLKKGSQAQTSYSDWHKIKTEFKDAIQSLKKEAKASASGASILRKAVKISAKGLKVAVVVTIIYDVTTDGVSVAAENAVTDTLWPLPIVAGKAQTILNGLYDPGIEHRRELNNAGEPNLMSPTIPPLRVGTLLEGL